MNANPPDPSEQTIFDAAQQIPDPQARSAYPDAACAGDAPLRERVERLLRAGQRADEFLAGERSRLRHLPDSSGGDRELDGCDQLLRVADAAGAGGRADSHQANSRIDLQYRIQHDRVIGSLAEVDQSDRANKRYGLRRRSV